MRLIDADATLEQMKGMNMLFSPKIVIDNMPTIDLAEHDKQIRDEVVDEFVDALTCQACFTNMQKDAIRIYAEQMKEEQNE